ncbi:MAG: hypothetical protein HQK65_20755 [Desulfamplus sp.]|nr:hypothetical protein [Desulfamplus sp.]
MKAPLAVSQETVNLVRIEHLAEQVIGEMIVPEFFNKMGKLVNITSYPGLRCNSLATRGSVDGEMMRIYNYGVRNPSLIRVPQHNLWYEIKRRFAEID